MRVDETHFLKKNGAAVWLFGMYFRGANEVRLIVVGNDRSQNVLLPIISKYVYTDDDDQNGDVRTRIYSDGWGAYSTNEIEDLGFAHRRESSSG